MTDEPTSPLRRRYRDRRSTDTDTMVTGAGPVAVATAAVEFAPQVVATRLTALQRLGYRMLIVSIVLCCVLAALLSFAPSEATSQSRLAGVVWTLLLLAMAVSWRATSDGVRRGFLYTILAVLLVRWIAAWFGDDATDRVVAVLTANMIMPALLIITAMIHQRRTGIVLGSVFLAVFGVVGLVGSLRPALDGDALADWRLWGLYTGINGVLLMMVGWLARTRDEFVVTSTHSLALLEAAVRDPLTGLFNRRGIDMLLEDGTWAAPEVVVAVIDIDHFKRINDTFGHDEGDAVLRRGGAALLAAVGADDLAGRLGGEEFLVVAGGADPSEPTGEFVDRVRRSLSSAGTAVTASAGWTYWHRDLEPHSMALARADAALYEAKRSGRDRTVRAASDDGPHHPA